MKYDLVIRGGTVVTAADASRCDVGIRGGRIAALGEDLAGAVADGGRVVDATGKLVLPGGDRQPLPHRTALRLRVHDRGRLPERHRLGRVRRNHDGHPLRRPAPGTVAPRGRGGVPRPRRTQGGHRLRLPPHHLRRQPPGARAGAAGAHPGRIYVVQGLHDLRAAPARRLLAPQRAVARAPRGGDGDGARRELRDDPVAHRPAPRGGQLPGEVPRGLSCRARRRGGDGTGHRALGADGRADPGGARVDPNRPRRRFAARATGACGCTGRPARSTSFSPRTTSIARGRKGRSSAAARRRGTKRTTRQCGGGS